MGESERGSRHLADTDLADEIELYGELVVAASESQRDLSLPEIDEVLGVRDDGSGMTALKG